MPNNEKVDSIAKRTKRVLTAIIGTPWCEVVSNISDLKGKENETEWTESRSVQKGPGTSEIYKWRDELLNMDRYFTRVVVG